MTLAALAENTGYTKTLAYRIDGVSERIRPIREGNAYAMLDRKIKNGENLNFNDAFTLMTFVSAALNKPVYETLSATLAPQETLLLQATALLSAMSTKEALVGLTAEEIAGMVAATIHIDTVARPNFSEPVLAFGGMGGDKGYSLPHGQSKLFSLSTLSSVSLAVDGPVHKHHSYPNTSKVAGQSAIEVYGARSDFDAQEAMEQVLSETGLLMTSCHNTRTIHTLSHKLRGETINHVIGPLAFTLSAETPIHAFIGVNEKIHPATIIEALQLLHQEGFQYYTDSAVFCGTDLQHIPFAMLDPQTYKGYKEHIRLDEIAPPPFASIVSFLVAGENKGSFTLLPEDFYDEKVLQQIRFENLVIPNDVEEIKAANNAAILGEDRAKAMYLAMTIGLGLFVRHCLRFSDALDMGTKRVNKDYLQACTSQAYALLQSGKAAAKLHQYVETTKIYAGGGR